MLSPSAWNVVSSGKMTGLFANGGVFDRGNVIPFARGDIFHSPTHFPMSGGRTGLMGEAGPEAIMPLRRGSDGRLGVAAASQAPVINQTIINNTSAKVTTRDEPDGQGGKRQVVMIDDMVSGAISRPGSKSAKAMRSDIGARARITAR